MFGFAFTALPASASLAYNGYSFESSGGNYGNINYYNNTNPAPILSSVSPNQIMPVNGNLDITLTGAYFLPGAEATFNNNYRQTVYNNSGNLTIRLNISDVVNPGTNIIVVYNPDGRFSNKAYFTVMPAPQTITYPTVVETSEMPIHKTTSVKSVPSVQKEESKTTNTDLTANALFSGSGFMPSSIIGWLILAILILLLVLLVRKNFFEKNYHDAPLKH